MQVAGALMQLRPTKGKDGKSKNDSIHVPFGLFFFFFFPLNSICAPKMAICIKSYYVHIEQHVQIYMFVYNSNRVDAVVWAAAIRWLLDWMEQLTNAVSGCHAVARFRFFLLFFFIFYIHTNTSEPPITGCLLHARLCCSLCKHNFERSRHRKYRCDYVGDLCGRRIDATAAIYKFITNTNVRRAWKAKENELNGENTYLVADFVLSIGPRTGLLLVRCLVPVHGSCVCVSAPSAHFSPSERRNRSIYVFVELKPKILPIGGCDNDKPSVR